MSKNVIHYGKVSFADVCVGSIVKVVDYYESVAVGIVEEKIEAIGKKTVTVRMGFEETITVIIEEETCDNRGNALFTVIKPKIPTVYKIVRSGSWVIKNRKNRRKNDNC